MLVDIPTAWARTSVDQKQRAQNVLNPDNKSLFSQLENFVGGKMSFVRPKRFELLTYSFEDRVFPILSIT
jgi:hypothetical protein